MPRQAHRANGAASRNQSYLDVEALVKQMLNRPSYHDFLLDACTRLALLTTKDLERINTTPIVTMLMQLMKAHPGLALLQANVMFVITAWIRKS